MRANVRRGLEITPKSVGAKLTLEALGRRGMGQRELARAIDIGQAQLNRYLRGTTKMSLEAAIRIQDWSNGEIAPRAWLVPLTGSVVEKKGLRNGRSRRRRVSDQD